MLPGLPAARREAHRPNAVAHAVHLFRPDTRELTLARDRAAYFHAQHWLLNWHSLHCHPTTGGNTPAATPCKTSEASRKSRTLAARSREVQYRCSSGCLVFVRTSNRSRTSL